MKSGRSGNSEKTLWRSLAAAVVLVGLLPTLTRADVMITTSATSWTVAAGGTGSFDIILTNTGRSAILIAAWNTSMESQDPLLTFTGADGSTADAYIFGTVQFSPLASDTFPGSTVTVSDMNLDGLGNSVNATILAGQTYGLAHVTFSIDPLATPGSTISLLFGSGTSITEEDGTPVSFVDPVGNGPTVTIAVPEPSAVVLVVLLSGVAGLMVARRRRNAARLGGLC